MHLQLRANNIVTEHMRLKRMKGTLVMMMCVPLMGASQADAQHKKKAKSKSKTTTVAKAAQGAVLKFKDSETHDFGNIPSGPDVYHNFTFTNTGDEPLIIQDCNPSCSCTTPEWPHQPILPGKTAAIKVGFHTNHPGPFTKQVSILSNSTTAGTDKRMMIYIKGTVTGDAKPTPGK